jgi:hypothetical protein
MVTGGASGMDARSLFEALHTFGHPAATSPPPHHRRSALNCREPCMRRSRRYCDVPTPCSRSAYDHDGAVSVVE